MLNTHDSHVGEGRFRSRPPWGSVSLNRLAGRCSERYCRSWPQMANQEGTLTRFRHPMTRMMVRPNRIAASAPAPPSESPKSNPRTNESTAHTTKQVPIQSARSGPQRLQRHALKPFCTSRSLPCLPRRFTRAPADPVKRARRFTTYTLLAVNEPQCWLRGAGRSTSR